MSKFELKLPRMGESVAEATLTAWLKEIGDTIELDEPIFEIATDKVDSEVPSEVEGVLVEKRFEVDDVVKIGQVVAVIETEGEDSDSSAQEDDSDAKDAEESATLDQNAENRKAKERDAGRRDAGKPNIGSRNEIEPPKEAATQIGDSQERATAEVQQMVTAAKDMASAPRYRSDASQQSLQQSSDRFYSPLVKNIAQQEGISVAELDAIPGSGKEGRVTKNDILEYVEKGKAAGNRSEPSQALMSQKNAFDKGSQKSDSLRTDSAEIAIHQIQSRAAADSPKNPGAGQLWKAGEATSKAQGASTEKQASTAVPYSDNHEVIEMTRMGKLIAKHMTDSVTTSAHVQSFVEVDVTAIVNWRNRIKKDFEQREGEKLTFTPIFMEAVAKALKKYPMMNISVDGDKVIKKKNINIGMAAALPDGNLIVPVIKNADQLNLVGMAKVVNDLASRARDNRLKPDEVQDGTYTVTNVGTFGSVFGTPIINQPQVGILALGAIRKLPAVIETTEGDFIGIRSKMYLSHSYDHRVVNGALGSMFVRAVADYLENWETDREV